MRVERLGASGCGLDARGDFILAFSDKGVLATLGARASPPAEPR